MHAWPSDSALVTSQSGDRKSKRGLCQTHVAVSSHASQTDIATLLWAMTEIMPFCCLHDRVCPAESVALPQTGSCCQMPTRPLDWFLLHCHHLHIVIVWCLLLCVLINAKDIEKANSALLGTTCMPKLDDRSVPTTFIFSIFQRYYSHVFSVIHSWFLLFFLVQNDVLTSC
jgi:hypothetical protein